MFLFCDEVLSTHQGFCDPHLSLCASTVPYFINRSKAILSPVPSHYSLPKNTGRSPGFMGPFDIRFSEGSKLRVLYLVTVRSIHCCTDYNSNRASELTYLRTTHHPSIHRNQPSPDGSSCLFSGWTFHCQYIQYRRCNLGCTDRRGGKRD